MALMAMLGVMLVIGLALSVRWSGVLYRPWATSGDMVPVAACRRYLRGLALAAVGGMWTGLLVTGPAVRLIMRLLAVTAGDRAQGMQTEAEEVVGDIDLDGTIGLFIFGGLLPALVSAGIYVVIRRWLPAGRWGGIAFGVLHLVVVATRVDPLRADNPDFDIVGPGWLAALLFGVACLAHGVAVAAFTNRFSLELPARAGSKRSARVVVPLVPTVFVLLASAFFAIPIAVGLAVALVVSRIDVARRRWVDPAGRLVLAGLALVTAPGALLDLIDIAGR